MSTERHRSHRHFQRQADTAGRDLPVTMADGFYHLVEQVLAEPFERTGLQRQNAGGQITGECLTQVRPCRGKGQQGLLLRLARRLERHRPSQTTGAAHAASNAFLAAHAVVAAALLASAIMVVRHAARAGGRWRRLAIWGVVTIVITVGAGILTLSTKSSWWSYAMAAGFIASLLIYGGILVWASTPPARNPSESV